MLKQILLLFGLVITLGLSLYFLNNQEISTSNTVSFQKTHDDMYLVIRVVDGDTFMAEDKNGISSKVRLIGIDTPESVDPRRKVECFGKEATLELKRLIRGKYVRMEGDSSQQDIDKYQRLLRYVYLDDGTLVNKAMIENGYAFEYTYKVAYEHQNMYKKSEKVAKEEGRGLWATNACK